MNNYSKQREQILEVIKKNRIHPTAEEIYCLVEKEDPKISKSTVYRNINVLLKQGLIQKIAMVTGADRYDYQEYKHDHVICEVCGKVFDFYDELEKEKIEKAIEKANHNKFKINGITVYGICEDCKSKSKN